MKHMPAVLGAILSMVLLLPVVSSCYKDAHLDEYQHDYREGGIIVGLVSDAPVSDYSLFVFGSDGVQVSRTDYKDPRELAQEHRKLYAGAYTVMVVANVKAEALPQEPTALSLVEWVNENSEAWPDMLSASAYAEVVEGEVTRLLLTLQASMAGIDMECVQIMLTVPDDAMPVYSAALTKSGRAADARLRCVAEIFVKGTRDRVHRRVQICEPQDDGTYMAELFLLAGDYDIMFWADWSGDGSLEDKYYNTEDLSQVTVMLSDYVANGETDLKAAYYGAASVEVGEGTGGSTVPDVDGGSSVPDDDQMGDDGGSQTPDDDQTGDDGGSQTPDDDQTKVSTTNLQVTLSRPFARYRLVADDVKAYNNLISKGEDLPPIEDLTVIVAYQGYFPISFNLFKGVPNDALTSISYSAGIVEAEGFDLSEGRQVGADFVLSDGNDSFVTVTVNMVNKYTGDVVSSVSGVRVDYRRGYLTTVTGTFLTAGRTSSGVQIDTEWTEEVIIPF